MESLSELLAWLTGSGGGAFLMVSGFLAWAFEKSPWFQNLQVKLLVIALTTGLLGAGAAWLQMHPDLVAQIDPYFRPFMYGIMALSGSQVAHAINPFRKKS